MGLLDELDARRERAANAADNSARLAQAYAVYETTGQGTMQHEGRIKFELTFVEKPMMAYGAACDMDDLADVLGTDPEDTPLPICMGYVTEWDKDERDFYTGCWIAVRVYFPQQAEVVDPGGGQGFARAAQLDEATGVDESSGTIVDPAAAVVIEHHFTWSAIGLKDIPPSAEDATL